MRRKRSPSKVRLQLRLYPGQDDGLIRWLARFDDHPYGAKSQAVKEALRLGIGGGDSGQTALASTPAVELTEIRQVVEAALETALARFESQVSRTALAVPEGDDETEALLDSLEAALVLTDE